MCISTVHYCCHRNVMHSVSYRLTQLNGKPCLICSGSFILTLYWKGIVNTVWGRDERGEGRRGCKNKRERGGWILPSALFSHLSSHPSFLSLPSNVCSVHWQSVGIGGIIYSYSYIILRTHCYIFSHSVTLGVLALLIGSGGGRRCFQRHRKLLVFTMWWQRRSFIWDDMDTGDIWGSGVFIHHRMNCIACYLYSSYLLSHWFFHL